jgi:transposase InsO family protein
MDSLPATWNPRILAHPLAAGAGPEGWGLGPRVNLLVPTREVDGTLPASVQFESVGWTQLGLKVITTPVRSRQANSLCERLIGTLRRECQDWIIPLSEGHVRRVLASSIAHYNRGKPHSSLGPVFLISVPSSSLCNAADTGSTGEFQSSLARS